MASVGGTGIYANGSCKDGAVPTARDGGYISAEHGNGVYLGLGNEQGMYATPDADGHDVYTDLAKPLDEKDDESASITASAVRNFHESGRGLIRQDTIC